MTSGDVPVERALTNLTVIALHAERHWTEWTPFCNLASGTNRCVTILEIIALMLVAIGIVITVVLIRGGHS